MSYLLRHWALDLSSPDLRAYLKRTNLHPNVVDDLVRQRDAAGAQWRIAQELGPLRTHVDTCVLPAEGERVVCVCASAQPEPPPPAPARLEDFDPETGHRRECLVCQCECAADLFGVAAGLHDELAALDERAMDLLASVRRPEPFE